MKIATLIIVLLGCHNIFSQDCSNCPTNLLSNGDFEIFDTNCPTLPGFEMGFEAFQSGCVGAWEGTGITPDLLSPEMLPALVIPGELFTNNNVAAMCYNLGAGHIEEVTNDFILLDDADIRYSVDFDYSALCMNDFNFSSLFTSTYAPIHEGNLEVSLVSDNGIDNIGSFALNNSTDYSAAETFANECLSDIQVNGQNTKLRFRATTPVPNSSVNLICYGLVDNVELSCNIVEHSCKLVFQDLGDGNYTLDIVNCDPSLSIGFYEWNLGSGPFNGSASITAALDIGQEVSVILTDSRNCCTSLTIVIPDCGNTVLEGNSDVDDLIQVLNVSTLNNITNINDLATAVAEVEVNGVLEINSNVVFGPNLNFLLTEGSSISVKSGLQLTKNFGSIGPCHDIFEGIFLEENAILDINNVTISGANTAIWLRENSVLKAVGCNINNSTYGVFVSGKGKIPTFSGNTFDNCDYGLNAESTGVLNIISTGLAPNSFLNCDKVGLSYYRTAGQIMNNIFDNCKVGISLNRTTGDSVIENNIINGREKAISIVRSQETIIQLNTIGATSPLPRFGIYSDFSDIVVADNPLIKASWRAVASYHPIFNTVWNNHDIQVDSGADDSYGIYLWKGNAAGTIGWNNISGNMRDVIFGNSCISSSFYNSILSGGRNHGISMAGGSGMKISGNEISGIPHNAIGLYSATGSTIGYNEINSENVGLLVNPLSATQTIYCNDFITANKDIVTRAVLSPQWHHNNEFRRTASEALTQGLSFSEVLQSKFTVDTCTNATTLCKHPEDWAEDEFFEIKQYDPNDPNNPMLTAPLCETFISSITSDPDYWCWYFMDLDSTRATDPRKTWIQKYKALSLHTHSGGQLIPEPCIEIWPEDDCGILELIAIEQALQTTMAHAAESSTDFVQTIETDVQTLFTELDTIDCSDDIAELYLSTYRSMLKNMIDQALTESELSDLQSTAELCPDIYGDVVFWARGVLDHRGSSEIYSDLACDEEEEEGSSARNRTDSNMDKILVTPNPADDYFLVENKTGYDILQVYISDTHGKIIKIQTMRAESMRIDCSTFIGGLYIITASHNSGFTTVEKVFVRP